MYSLPAFEALLLGCASLVHVYAIKYINVCHMDNVHFMYKKTKNLKYYNGNN